jgi:hypothetical protein
MPTNQFLADESVRSRVLYRHDSGTYSSQVGGSCRILQRGSSMGGIFSTIAAGVPAGADQTCR